MTLARRMVYFGISCFSTGAQMILLSWAIVRNDIGAAVFCALFFAFSACVSVANFSFAKRFHQEQS